MSRYMIKVEKTGQSQNVQGETYFFCTDNHWRTQSEITSHNNEVDKQKEKYKEHYPEAIQPQLIGATTMVTQKVLNKLNGLKAGESNYVELSQPVSENRELKLDLAHILAGSSEFQGLKLGTNSLVKDVTINGDSLSVKLSVGEVKREETEAVRIALQKLVSSAPKAE